MTLRIRVSLFLGLIYSFVSSASADFTDFSDFTASQTFSTDEVFSSRGVEFRAISLFPPETNARILIFPDFDASFLIAGPGVEFILPEGTQEISFFYSNGGGRLAVLNGEELPISPENGLSIWDGLTVAGVKISTDVSEQSVRPGFGVTSERGTITFTGPITSFAIAGVELSIDDVSIVVPEPSTLLLLVLGSPFLLRRPSWQVQQPLLTD
ncbi:MAG: PEP-CTERM sorting domain-containing protein [Planctomycetota bacterium]